MKAYHVNILIDHDNFFRSNYVFNIPYHGGFMWQVQGHLDQSEAYDLS